MNILVKKNEKKEICVCNDLSIDFTLEKNSFFWLKYFIFNKTPKITFNGCLKENSFFKSSIIDLSLGNSEINACIDLNASNANVNWELISLVNNSDKKKIEIIINHNKPGTKAVIDNKGFVFGNSSLFLINNNDIKSKAKKSEIKQNAKIILFDNQSKGKVYPILKINENDIVTKHQATIGNLNSEYLFYLKSRGFSDCQIKKMIIEGYLKDIMVNFDYLIQEKIKKEVKRYYV